MVNINNKIQKRNKQYATTYINVLKTPEIILLLIDTYIHLVKWQIHEQKGYNQLQHAWLPLRMKEGNWVRCNRYLHVRNVLCLLFLKI